MYKVTYRTLAIMSDGSKGNIVQSKEVVYTDLHLSRIETEIDKLLLADDDRAAIIDKVENIDGWVLSDLVCDPVKVVPHG